MVAFYRYRIQFLFGIRIIYVTGWSYQQYGKITARENKWVSYILTRVVKIR